VKFRTKTHYVKMLERNGSASIGHTLAAYMILAAQNGLVFFEKDDDAVRAIARRLKAEYGEELSTEEVRGEMGL
jgi:hypothetical protein